MYALRLGVSCALTTRHDQSRLSDLELGLLGVQFRLSGLGFKL